MVQGSGKKDEPIQVEGLELVEPLATSPNPLIATQAKRKTLRLLKRLTSMRRFSERAAETAYDQRKAS